MLPCAWRKSVLAKKATLKVHCYGYTMCLYMIDYRLEPSKIAVRALRNSLVEG